MKKAQFVAHLLRTSVVCAAVAAALCAAPTRAAQIQIAFTGMNLAYNGSTIYDAGSAGGGVGNPANADPLTTVDFFLGNSLVGSLNSDISADISIPDVTGIPAAPNTIFNQVTPGNPGYFDLLIGTSPLAADYLRLDLNNVTVTYFDVSGIVQFTFGAAVASSSVQNLPFSLEIGDPVSLAFSAQLEPGTKLTSGGFVTGFQASGTGDIRGEQIPEPSTVALAAMGALAIPAYLWRRRRR